MKSSHICIAIPTYNGEKYISETLKYVFRQNYKNFSVVISDDGSTDTTVKIARSFQKKYNKINLRIYTHKKNIGCSGNFKRLKRYARGDVLYLLCQDDILLPHAIKNTAHAFKDPSVGVVTRPYWWFDNDIFTPHRVVYPLSKSHTVSIDVTQASCYKIEKIVESAGQASGLAFRMKSWKENFHNDIFVTHIYPFFSISRKMKVAYLHNYTIAVRIKSSQSRTVSSVYNISPTFSWIRMFETVFSNKKFARVGRIGKSYMLKHFVGLVQIRNYSTYKNVLKEIYILATYQPRNLLHIRFWAYSLICLLSPRLILQQITDAYKKYILNKIIKRKFRLS